MFQSLVPEFLNKDTKKSFFRDFVGSRTCFFFNGKKIFLLDLRDLNLKFLFALSVDFEREDVLLGKSTIEADWERCLNLITANSC